MAAAAARAAAADTPRASSDGFPTPRRAPRSGASGVPGAARGRTLEAELQIAERIRGDVNTAMKAGERERVTALRLVLSELQKAQKEGGADELAVLRRERKRRREAEEAYKAAGRTASGFPRR